MALEPPAFERPEDRALLTGAATFVGDLLRSSRSESAHAVFIRSPYAHARVLAVDVAAAKSAPGVLAVVVGSDLPVDPYAPAQRGRFQRPLLAADVVRFVGESVAVLVAESAAEAVDAAELVEVDYEPLAAALTQGQSTEVMTDISDREISTPRSESVVGGCEVVVRYEMDNPRQSAVPMETRGALARWQGERLELWESTQRPHRVKQLLRQCYGLDDDAIRVVAGPFVGGGFGGKGMPAVEALVLPYLARLTGRPVRWEETRSDYMRAAPQGRGELVSVELGGTADGTLQAIRVEIDKDGGAYAGSGADLAASYAFPNLNVVYDIPTVEFDTRTMATNKPVVGALRGAGRAPMIAAVERTVDQFAARIDMDPASLRRKNLIDAATMPFISPTGARFDEADYPAALDVILKAAGYEQLRSEQTERRADPTQPQLGIGLGCFNLRTNGAGPEQAVVRIKPDGSAVVVTGTTSQGHGHTITWAKLVEQDLGIPAARITVIEGDTDAIATGVGAIGSRSVQTAGIAVQQANAQLIEDGRHLAADLLEAALGDVRFEPAVGFHVAGTPARALAWTAVAAEQERRGEELKCDTISDPDALEVYPSGCHLAVVETDIETGGWKLVRYVAADDVGTRISPTLVAGQVHGGVSMGVGQVLGEEVVFDEDGNPLTSSFMDYQIPSIDQFCQFELHAVDVPSSSNAGGYKAVGESGPIGATPAVHNAVVDSVRHLGVTEVPLPCSPQRVWRAIVDARR